MRLSGFCHASAFRAARRNPTGGRKWFFDNSLVGDVVIVENSPDDTVAPDNGLNGWNMPWSEWTTQSTG
ncbi:hypothetical protein ACIQFU_24355 [Streptomyces sp. NPDC093065]|uniref:hypothetical protein n=1 Tax=Streptomyces sp. NPDC093065 TaxID=3366021 RepID=UPI00381D1039